MEVLNLMYSEIVANAAVIFRLRRSDIFAYAEVILFSPNNCPKGNITCEANITGVANRTGQTANITENTKPEA